MNKHYNRVLEILKTKCKDFGLTDQAIADLAKEGSEGLADDASDEDVVKRANSFVNIAKIMQGESTRKVQKTKEDIASKASKEKTEEEEEKSKSKSGTKDDEKDNGKIPQSLLDRLGNIETEMKTLKTENEALKKEKAEGERKATISATAKELGIPDYLMEHFSIAENEDIRETLSNFKQKLIESGLPHEESTPVSSSTDKGRKEEAESWAKNLPDNTY